MQDRNLAKGSKKVGAGGRAGKERLRKGLGGLINGGVYIWGAGGRGRWCGL